MWDVADPSQRAELQKAGLEESVSHIAEVIAKESAFVSTENIILGGISQGWATAVVCLLVRGKHKLGGFTGFSSWLPELIQADEASKLPQTPVFVAHCADDEVVPIENGRRLCEKLEGRGLVVSWKEYRDGGHWLNELQGIDDLVHFLRDKTL